MTRVRLKAKAMAKMTAMFRRPRPKAMVWANGEGAGEVDGAGDGARLDRGRHAGRGLRDGRGRPDRRGCGGGHRGRRTPRVGPDTSLGRLGICGMGASPSTSEGEQRDAHSRHDPHRDGRDGDGRSGIGSDAIPAHMPDRPREPREPYPFRVPGYPTAIRHRISSGGGAEAQDLLPQLGRQRGQRQQAGKRRRAHCAPTVLGAGPAVLDVPDDQVARLFGQLPIPVGQQLPQYRAGLPSGKRNVQRTESFLQAASGA